MMAKKRKLDADAKPSFPFGRGDVLFENCLSRESSNQSENTVTLAQLLDVQHTTRVLLSTMTYDDAYIRQECRGIPSVCVVVDAGNEEEGMFLHRGWSMVHPPKAPSMGNSRYGCQHVKLMAIESPHGLRLVVSSANATMHEWCEMGNQVWFQDFPRVVLGDEGSKVSPFLETLCLLWDAWRFVPAAFGIDWLRQFDFSDAKGQLVLSLPGEYDKHSAENMGHQALRRATVHLNPSPLASSAMQTNTLDIQTATIGFFEQRFCDQFLASALQGGAKKTQVRIIYPTHATGCQLLGPNGVDNVIGLSQVTIPENYATGPKFQRGMFHDLVAVRNVAQHTKILVRRWTDPLTGNDRGWCYTGSHNLSAAAWGSFVRGGKLRIRNYELGIVLPRPFCFVNKEPTYLPFDIPPTPYGPRDKPWNIDNAPAKTMRYIQRLTFGR